MSSVQCKKEKDFNHSFDAWIRDGTSADSRCDEYRQACVDKNRCQVSIDRVDGTELDHRLQGSTAKSAFTGNTNPFVQGSMVAVTTKLKAVDRCDHVF
jgi:hypothetical protein